MQASRQQTKSLYLESGNVQFTTQMVKRKRLEKLFSVGHKTRAQWGICNVSLNIASMTEASLKHT